MAEQTGRRRLQLQLADLLFVMLLVGLLCGFFLPAVLGKHFPGNPGVSFPCLARAVVPAHVYLIGVAGVLLGALPMLLLGNRAELGRGKRWFIAMLFGIASSSLALAMLKGFYIQPPDRSGATVAVAACKAFVTAQNIYRRKDWDYDGILEYSQRGSGEHGLADPNLMLIDRTFGAAFWGEEQTAVPKCGYIFKMLKGEIRTDGTWSYLGATGDQTRGYAMVAAPAVYGLGGQTTFIVSKGGRIYQRDFGERTPEVFKEMVLFEVDEGWVLAE